MRRGAAASPRRKSPPDRASEILCPGAPSRRIDLAAEEERLEAVVGGARQQHAAQDLETLVARQRRGDRRAAQEAVAGVEQFGVCLIQPRRRGRSRRGVGEAVRQRARLQALFQLALQRPGGRPRSPSRPELASAGRLLEGVERVAQRERMPLGDECAEVACESSQLLELSRLWHEGIGIGIRIRG